VDDVQYLQPPPQLASIRQRTTEVEFSTASEPLVGAMLRMLAASKPGGRFLELGTGTGIATAWLLQGMDERSTLISVDNDGAVQALAKDSLGADKRLTLLTTAGSEFLRRQPAELSILFLRMPCWENTRAWMTPWPLLN